MKKLDRLTEATPAVRENREKINEIIKVLGKRGSFTPPSPQDVEAYARQYATEEKGVNGNIDGKDFCDFYEKKGWKVGQSKMVSWQAAVRGCVRKGWAQKIPSDRALDEKKLRDKAYADKQEQRIRRDYSKWLMCKSTTKEMIEVRIKAFGGSPLMSLAMELRPELFGVAK